MPSALTAILTSRRPESVGLSPPGDLLGRALLPPGVHNRVVVVHDDEPTSIVAYFLSTKEHQSFLEECGAFILSGGPRPERGMPSRLAKTSNSGSDLPAIEALASRPVSSDIHSGRVV